MREVPVIEPELYTRTNPTLRFLARDSRDHVIALVYWLGLRLVPDVWQPRLLCEPNPMR
jgi:hypothetical protein